MGSKAHAATKKFVMPCIYHEFQKLLIKHEFASRGGYKQLKGNPMGLQKCLCPWSSSLWFKSSRAFYGAPIS